MASNIAVKGLNDVIKGLDTFHGRVDKALTHALKEAVQEIHLAVKAIAPVKTGKYRNSIKWRVAKSGLIGWVYASRKAKGAIRGSSRDTKNSRSRDVDGYIGHFLEYGTRRARPIHHWEPVRSYMIVKFGPRLEIAVKGVKMYRTKTDG